MVKTIGQLPVPPTFVPRATDELPGVVSTSGHCPLGDSIDTIVAPCLQVEQSHEAETFGKLRAFSLHGNERRWRTQTHVHKNAQYPAVADDQSAARELQESALAQFTVFLSLCFASSGE